jgi:hypothetical protein
VDHFTRLDHQGVHWGNIEYKSFVEEHRANVMCIPYEYLVDVCDVAGLIDLLCERMNLGFVIFFYSEF